MSVEDEKDPRKGRRYPLFLVLGTTVENRVLKGEKGNVGMMVKGSNLMPDASWQRNPGYAAREDGLYGVLPEAGWVEYEDGYGMLICD